MSTNKGKVLIYANEEEFAPIGGPMGYLYNLREGLRNKNDLPIEIHFLKKELPKNSIKKHTGIKKIHSIRTADSAPGITMHLSLLVRRGKRFRKHLKVDQITASRMPPVDISPGIRTGIILKE